MDLVSTRAIVLRTRDAGAADRLVTLLTPRLGRLPCAAKNARRSFRRFGGALTLFAEIEAEIVAREGREFARIESAVLVEPFEGIRRAWRPFALASTGAELVDRVAHGNEEAPALYQQTRAFLAAMAAGAAAAVLTSFELGVLAAAGFRPELDHCVVCGRPASATRVARHFDIHRGGLLCPSCGKKNAAGMRRRFVSLGDAARAVLKGMLAGGARWDLAGAGVPPAVQAECAGLVNALVAERLGAPLRTWSVW